MSENEMNYGQKKTLEYAEKIIENRNASRAINSKDLAEKTFNKLEKETGNSPVTEKTIRSYLTTILKQFDGFSNWVNTFHRKEGQGTATRYYYDARTDKVNEKQ